MSKRRGQDDNMSQIAGKRSRPAPKKHHNMSQIAGKRSRPAPKKHLYLVLGDYEKGYSIRQIDPDTMLSDSYDTVQDLPEPAAFRFAASAIDTRFFAMGSKIIVVSNGGEMDSPTLVYDTEAAALTTAPPLPGHLAGPILPVANGNALYALTTLGTGLPPSFEKFSWTPCTRDTDDPWPSRKHEWSWKSIDAPPPPTSGPERRRIVSYAAHPDGRTIFVTTRDAAIGGVPQTYSLDTERRGEWTPHGAWALPFLGQGYYDRELDAWVGLDKDPGYICSCQVPSRTTCTTEPPESDRMEERLFGARDKRTLTYMGDSMFCLVASVPREDEEGLAYDPEVRVTTFGLKFDRKGELKTTSHRKTSSYVPPKYVPFFSPVAFWM